MSRIYHLAEPQDWDAARAAGAYEISTRGRTLAQEGFIHASEDTQWQTVRSRFYADVEGPLLLLEIDTDRLTAPLVREPAAEAGGELFPHIHGPLNTDAVVAVHPLEPPHDA
ncbi:DUF952 domain-containing protein [Luteipulveratus flavus]|uniref:DUF952 domain-containing protein n=1 Tax=Luteipulveratus flavus TaxID=3031728 RepID=A0ABT6C456_9MICO|nr:DUF952 domain-containing protein [Luteipulveratus sp. YIM 133296]MDF8263466.1 DUF952 domain-containing protein [Luteipulveratus sp. YIM 133296]